MPNYCEKKVDGDNDDMYALRRVAKFPVGVVQRVMLCSPHICSSSSLSSEISMTSRLPLRRAEP
jgi:hypothetical protein